MLRNSNMPITSDVNTHTCRHCLIGKMSRLSFPEKIDRVDVPFHKIHSDVWGPSPVVSLEDSDTTCLLLTKLPDLYGFSP